MTTPALQARREAVHAVLDPLWQTAVERGGYKPKRTVFLAGPGGHAVRKLARERVYAWLAEQMWLTAAECHVARFDAAQCECAIGHLRAITYREIRDWARGRAYQNDILKRATERRTVAP